MCIRDRRWARGERLVVRELLIALTTNVSIFDSECSLPLTIRKHKEWFFRPVQGRHYVLATLRNRKRQTQDSNPRFTAPTEIRRKHRPQMDASDDFVTLSQARTRLGQCDEVIRRVHLGPMLPANFRGGRESWIGILRLAFP